MLTRIALCVSALLLLPSCMIASSTRTSHVEERTAPASEYAQDVSTQLYFVLDDGRARITDAQFREFVNREILSRFPDGFNIVAGEGHWRPRSENAARTRESRVVTLIHHKSEASDELIGEIIDCFREVFNEELVLRVDSPASLRWR